MTPDLPDKKSKVGWLSTDYSFGVGHSRTEPVAILAALEPPPIV